MMGTGEGLAGPNPAGIGASLAISLLRMPLDFISAHTRPVISPKTSPSSSELLASRFAPCTPLATSPAAYSPGTLVRPPHLVAPPTM